MAQTVCVILSSLDRHMLEAIVADRNRPQKQVEQAQVVLAAADRGPVQAVATRLGVSRPMVWRWQQRFAEQGADGLLRNKTRKPGKPPIAAELHPLALLREGLQRLGLHDTRRLGTARPGTWIRVPCLVLMRQRPGTAKGIVFITVEDEFGTANLVVYPDIGARDRAAMIGARLLVAEGRMERETEHAEVPITHLICRKLIDRSDLLNGLMRSGAGLRWGRCRVAARRRSAASGPRLGAGEG